MGQQLRKVENESILAYLTKKRLRVFNFEQIDETDGTVMIILFLSIREIKVVEE
jgi:hypothetical protein